MSDPFEVACATCHGLAAVTRPGDVRLAALKAELLHGMPELTGTRVNRAAMTSLVTIKQFERADPMASPAQDQR